MTLDVARPLRGDPAAGVWAIQRPLERGEPATMHSRAECETQLARFGNATASGVARVVAADAHVDKEYLDESGFNQPLVVKSPQQVDLIVPAPKSLSLGNLAAAIGVERPVRAINVATQHELADEWKLRQWMDYFKTPAAQRERVLNLISLECSDTRLERLVRPPKVVNEIGWVEHHWATGGSKKERATAPKVQLYCLMSAAGSYTEFHVDFGGSSVWYHLYQGRKFFYVIPPTDRNLARFVEWENAYRHSTAPFFGDLVATGDCSVVEMRAGDTMLLPSGWIHAVYTPDDSISFGGNFLSGYHMPTHLRCHAKEKRQQIDERFHFPEFECVVWYAAVYYAKMLKTCPSILSKWEWQGLDVLVDALKAWLAGEAHYLASTPDAQVVSRVTAICKAGVHCLPSEMLEKMAAAIDSMKPEEVVEEARSPPVTEHDDCCAELIPPEVVPPLHMIERVTPDEPRVTSTSELEHEDESLVAFNYVNRSRKEGGAQTSISPHATDESSTSSSSQDSSSDSSDSSGAESSDEDTGKESDHDPPATEDDDNMDTNESSNDSSSDDDSSSSSSSDEEDEGPPEPDENKEPQKEEEPEELDEPEESSSSDSDNGSDPESAYPELPPIPVDALIAKRKLAKLKELQITKTAKEKVVELARQHNLERHQRGRSKKKSGKAGTAGSGVAVVPTYWGDEDRWMVACSCGVGGENYDDGKEMVACDNCANWVHIGCVRIPIHEIFWCFKCREAPDDWLFVCPCGVKQKNFDDGIRMVQCEMCEAWQHTLCGGIPDAAQPPEVYECTNCRKLKKKKKSPAAAGMKKSKKGSTSKSKSGRSTTHEVASALVTTVSTTVTPSVPIPGPDLVPPPPVMSPPPTPPPPSAPPSPTSASFDSPATSMERPILLPHVIPVPPSKRKRGRPPLNKPKEKKTKRHDEDYVNPHSEPGSPAGVNGASMMVRPPLPITPKSTNSSIHGKRKSGGSARARLEKKLKIRKSRG